MNNPGAETRTSFSAHRAWWTFAIVVVVILLALFTSGVGCRLFDRGRDGPQADSPEPAAETKSPRG